MMVTSDLASKYSASTPADQPDLGRGFVVNRFHALGDRLDGLGELALLNKTNDDARRKLTQRLHDDIGVAEAQQNGDRFVQLANYAMQIEPGTAESLVVRTSQLGTSEPDLLRIVGGKVLYHRGAYAEAIALFENVPDDDLGKKRVALEWTNYLERESTRRDVIHNTLLELKK